jgi:hypothetical protein
MQRKPRGRKIGTLLQFLRCLATDFAGVERWNFAPESSYMAGLKKAGTRIIVACPGGFACQA